MARRETDYMNELTVHLRLEGMAGDEIGAVLEEATDHLATSGEDPESAFGPAEEYAAALARTRQGAGSEGFRLSRADLFAGAAQMIAWALLLYGIVALGSSDDVEIVPGYLVGWLILVVGLAWPVWPAVRALVAGKVGGVKVMLVMTLVVAASVAPGVLWDEPTLATIPPVVAIVASIVMIGACWLRAWRGRDPIRRPVTSRTEHRSATD